jgi:hypothetical protein
MPLLVPPHSTDFFSMSSTSASATSNASVMPNSNRNPLDDIDAFSTFADQDLTRLINAAATALRDRGLPPVPASLPPPPPVNVQHPRTADMWENARVKKIISSGLTPLYDGSSDQLIPTLNLINIRRRNEVWYSATFLTQDTATVDLVWQFSQAKLNVVLDQAKHLWTAADATTQSHTRGTQTYNNRLLGVFLLNLLTPEFAATLHSRIDPVYCADGPLLLVTMCQHIPPLIWLLLSLLKQRLGCLP